jgi:hypothetical protein
MSETLPVKSRDMLTLTPGEVAVWFTRCSKQRDVHAK